MKKNYLKLNKQKMQVFASLIAVSVLSLLDAQIFAQDFSAFTASVDQAADSAKPLVQSVIGLAALGGGIIVYFKMQNDEGNSGKKAVGNFVLALIFGALLITLVEVLL